MLERHMEEIPSSKFLLISQQLEINVHGAGDGETLMEAHKTTEEEEDKEIYYMT